jgi:hypothetical protein
VAFQICEGKSIYKDNYKDLFYLYFGFYEMWKEGFSFIIFLKIIGLCGFDHQNTKIISQPLS